MHRLHFASPSDIVNFVSTCRVAMSPNQLGYGMLISWKSCMFRKLEMLTFYVWKLLMDA
jgi:hypothetical protein